MKKEIKTSQRIVTDTFTVYIADDGKEFDNKIACENYEKDLKQNELEMKISHFKIDKLDGVLPINNAGEWRDVDASWYNVNREEDFNLIYEYYSLCSNGDYFNKPDSFPAIMCVVDDGNYADVYYLDDIINEVKSFFNIFNMNVTITDK